MQNPNEISSGMLVRTNKLSRNAPITKISLSDSYLLSRRSEEIGKVLTFVPGYGGDLWSVDHGYGVIAVYDYTEFEKVEFNLVGCWRVDIHDFVGSVMWVQFFDNSNFSAIQQVGPYKVEVHGEWKYDSITRQLELHGIVETSQKFDLILDVVENKVDSIIATEQKQSISCVFTPIKNC